MESFNVLFILIRIYYSSMLNGGNTSQVFGPTIEEAHGYVESVSLFLRYEGSLVTRFLLSANDTCERHSYRGMITSHILFYPCLLVCEGGFKAKWAHGITLRQAWPLETPILNVAIYMHAQICGAHHICLLAPKRYYYCAGAWDGTEVVLQRWGSFYVQFMATKCTRYPYGQPVCSVARLFSQEPGGGAYGLKSEIMSPSKQLTNRYCALQWVSVSSLPPAQWGTGLRPLTGPERQRQSSFFRDSSSKMTLQSQEEPSLPRCNESRCYYHKKKAKQIPLWLSMYLYRWQCTIRVYHIVASRFDLLSELTQFRAVLRFTRYFLTRDREENQHLPHQSKGTKYQFPHELLSNQGRPFWQWRNVGFSFQKTTSRRQREREWRKRGLSGLVVVISWLWWQWWWQYACIFTDMSWLSEPFFNYFYGLNVMSSHRHRHRHSRTYRTVHGESFLQEIALMPHAWMHELTT